MSQTRAAIHPGNGARSELAEWRTHTRVFLQPIAAPSIIGLFGFAVATFIVTAHLVGRVLDLHFDGTSEILRGDGYVLSRAPACDHGGHVTATVTC